MLRETITKEIIQAKKAHDKTRTYVLQMIKAKFQEFETSKGFKESDFTEAKEISIIQKMEKAWAEELEQFTIAGRDTTELSAQLEVLRTFLPVKVSLEDIEAAVIESGIEPVMKNTGKIIAYVHNKYQGADNKDIATVIKNLSSN